MGGHPPPVLVAAARPPGIPTDLGPARGPVALRRPLLPRPPGLGLHGDDLGTSGAWLSDGPSSVNPCLAARPRATPGPFSSRGTQPRPSPPVGLPPPPPGLLLRTGPPPAVPPPPPSSLRAVCSLFPAVLKPTIGGQTRSPPASSPPLLISSFPDCLAQSKPLPDPTRCPPCADTRIALQEGTPPGRPSL